MGIDGPEQETTTALKLERFDGRIQIREQEREISFVDKVYVVGRRSDGSTKIFPATHELLFADDSNYVILNQGGRVTVQFSGYDEALSERESFVEFILFSDGYYTPLGRTRSRIRSFKAERY